MLQRTRFFPVMLVVLALFLIGCSSEANATIFITDAEGKVLDPQASLLVVPVHREYQESATVAKSEEHLSVFLVYSSGDTQHIPLKETELMLEERILADETPYFFKSSGEKVVAIRYETLSAQYTIIVRSSTENPVGEGTSPTPSGGTGIVIEIKWN